MITERLLRGPERSGKPCPARPRPRNWKFLLPLIESYEEIHYHIDPSDPIEAIKIRMEELDLSRKDLESCIGSRGRVSDILNRRRALTLPMIRKLSAKLGLPGDVSAIVLSFEIIDCAGEKRSYGVRDPIRRGAFANRTVE